MSVALANNIISNVLKRHLSEPLPAWMGAQLENHLFITSLTFTEIRRALLGPTIV
ncbi:hypothetical protein ACVIHH_000129 [Bradyrhizobium sp. USDA 4518]|uniref:type II toxin-antitoxin system VapC family toxin n=1 Tax=Bradyrhizobium brasilense TaxID=1419277 RepID=UPI0011787A62|nr:type II toxin-antitoxin system VapC family toxin [Bradyrhizobium brasilense]